MRRLDFSPEAEADLLDIAANIASDNSARALSLIDELEARCADLLHFPESGTPRPALAPDLRSKPHGLYVIFLCAESESDADNASSTAREMSNGN